MAMKQMKAWIAALALASVLASVSAAQDVPLGDLKLFAPADVNPLSGNPKPKEGFFASFQLLHWAVQPPDKSSIGKEGFNPIVHDAGLKRAQSNSLSTASIEAQLGDGNRGEFGAVQGHWGWLFRGFKLKSSSQTNFGSDVDVVFQDTKIPIQFAQLDPGTGNVVGLFTVQVGFLDGFVDQSPVDNVDDDQDGDNIFGRFWDGDMDGVVDPTNAADVLDPRNYDLDDLVRIASKFSELTTDYRFEMWGVELMPFGRLEQFHNGGNLEIGFGVRYLRIDDQFNVQGRGLAVDAGNGVAVGNMTGQILNESNWDTDAENHVVGPQVSAHWFQQNGRWTLSAQGRFFAGWNFQNVYQKGSLAQSALGGAQQFQGPAVGGHNLFLIYPHDEFEHNLNETELSPGIEVELGASFQLTRAIAASVAWNGLWIDGIARSPNLVDFTLPRMGILASENRQDMFVHGFNVGIELNR